jgi:hypothetical protein
LFVTFLFVVLRLATVSVRHPWFATVSVRRNEPGSLLCFTAPAGPRRDRPPKPKMQENHHRDIVFRLNGDAKW